MKEKDINPKTILKQEWIIQSIKQFHLNSSDYCSQLEIENQELAINRLKQINQLKENIYILESICFIHGIIDLGEWIQKSPGVLISQAKESLQKKDFYLPRFHQSKLEKALPDEKDVIDKVLYREFYFSLVKNLQTIEKLKNQNRS